MSRYILSEEERKIFRQVLQDVTPLKENKLNITTKLQQPTTKLPHKKSSVHSRIHPIINPIYLESLQSVGSEAIISYIKHSLPHKRIQQLKNGQIPYTAKLDLHGCNVELATTTLQNFIYHNKQHRCILLIHGKGSMHGEAPILKNHINQLLRAMPEILAFHTAINKHGGSGAIYVLLSTCHNR